MSISFRMKVLIAVLLVCFLTVVTAFTAFPAKAQYYLTTITNPWTFQEEVTLEKSIDVASTTVEIGNVDMYFERDAVNTASTTGCAYRGTPAGTTTVDFVFSQPNSTTTAMAGSLSYGTKNATEPSASTTLIADLASIASGAKGVLRHSSSTPLGPNEWIVFTMKGADPFRLTGATCTWTARSAY